MERDYLAAEAIGRAMDPSVAHLILKGDWPIALCGFRASTFLGTMASGLDRCVACLQIAAARGLGRPGWEGEGKK